MSHIIQLDLRITRPELLADIARQRGIAVARNATVRLFSHTLTGMALSLPGWRYPVVVDADGVLHYDNYNGRWGNIAALNSLVQDYVVETVLQDARLAGQSVTRHTLDDGTIVLRVSA